jgi:2,4-dienoyl-CoA reductase-like NADH-dependent reductase (Old Yellow Enzyme family)
MRVAKMPTEELFHFVPKLRDSSPLVKLFYKTVLPLSVKKWLPLHNYNIETAEKIKARVKIPVIAVGGIRTITDIRRVIAGGKADYVSMSRPFIIEPDIVNKFFLQTQERSKCIDCGYCFFGVLGAPLKCYHGKI